MSRRTSEKPTVAVGTRVLVPLVWHKMEAVVIEHRGFIGAGGREMIRIQPLDPADDRGAFEIAVEEVEIAPRLDDGVTSRGAQSGQRARRGKVTASLYLPVGAHVRVQLPNSLLDMEVTEDRGMVDGRQIVRVRPLDEGYVSSDLEVAAADVEVLSLPPTRRGRAAA